jgi:tetratricopeptide (TPR) repeat protein
LVASFAIAQDKDPIDWNKARQIHQKFVRGEKLTAEEQAYHDRAVKAFQAGARPGVTAPPLKPPVGLKPLCDMTADDRYKGEDGGLYGGGKNVPPEKHLQAALEAARAIRSLDAEGRPVPKDKSGGKIGFISIGMSNTTQEFSVFVRLANADKEKSPNVVIVDGAQGGMDVQAWAEETPKGDPWKTLDRRLEQADVSSRQVQVAWIKQARIQPGLIGEYPKHADEMKGHMLTILRKAHERFPNLRLVYLSSRIYAGYARTGLNPEPYSYESAFVIRHLIQDQIKGADGAIKSPLLLWGPYLWADGEKGRKTDDLIWKPEDLGPDGTHPSTSGRQKVAELLLKFMKNDPTAKVWFNRDGARGSPVDRAKEAFEEGRTKYKAGHRDAALAAYDRAIQLDPQFAEAHLDRGLEFLDRGECEKAHRDLEDATKLDPNSSRARYGRGLYYLKMKDIDKALADFTDAIRLEPKWAGSYWSRGSLYWDRGEHGKAIADYSEAIHLRPDISELRFVRASYYQETGDFDNAIGDLTESIRLEPKKAWAFAARGLAYARKREKDKALADLSEAVRLDPKEPAFFYGRGNVNRLFAEYDNAIADYTSAILLNREDANFYRARGDAYKEKGEQAKADADYEEADRLQQKKPAAENTLGNGDA